ncbi:hypothetical protein BDA96_04G189500 [Sorghum bicolor]|uniref:Secreted protein n=1 Tax=Sorghum bicolor TaxID=4558 RepID=A0A921R6B7_SORBI|nr:hypothetical protein BDA96_04G189500 [Sorghum bicolor]
MMHRGRGGACACVWLDLKQISAAAACGLAIALWPRDSAYLLGIPWNFWAREPLTTSMRGHTASHRRSYAAVHGPVVTEMLYISFSFLYFVHFICCLI